MYKRKIEPAFVLIRRRREKHHSRQLGATTIWILDKSGRELTNSSSFFCGRHPFHGLDLHVRSVFHGINICNGPKQVGTILNVRSIIILFRPDIDRSVYRVKQFEQSACDLISSKLILYTVLTQQQKSKKVIQRKQHKPANTNRLISQNYQIRLSTWSAN
jgi:hypothetical protein